MNLEINLRKQKEKKGKEVEKKMIMMVSKLQKKQNLNNMKKRMGVLMKQADGDI
jgi:hypothetical protein